MGCYNDSVRRLFHRLVHVVSHPHLSIALSIMLEEIWAELTMGRSFLTISFNEIVYMENNAPS